MMIGFGLFVELKGFLANFFDASTIWGSWKKIFHNFVVAFFSFNLSSGVQTEP